MDKFKQITEYELMPKIPIQNNKVSHSIQEYSVKQENLWKLGLDEILNHQMKVAALIEESPRTKMRIFRRLKQKRMKTVTIDYANTISSLDQKLEHEEDDFLELRQSEHLFNNEYK